MDPYFTFTESVLKKERARARKIRASQWWKRKTAVGICHYCKESFLPGELTMDHIIPVGRGGKSEKFNLVPCCKGCNTQKSNLLPSEWEDYMERLRK